VPPGAGQAAGRQRLGQRPVRVVQGEPARPARIAVPQQVHQGAGERGAWFTGRRQGLFVVRRRGQQVGATELRRGQPVVTRAERAARPAKQQSSTTTMARARPPVSAARTAVNGSAW
jgi:hypothetical protein